LHGAGVERTGLNVLAVSGCVLAVFVGGDHWVIPTLAKKTLFSSTALAVIGSTMFCFKSAQRFPARERASPALPTPTPQGRPELRGLARAPAASPPTRPKLPEPLHDRSAVPLVRQLPRCATRDTPGTRSYTHRVARQIGAFFERVPSAEHSQSTGAT
jgi:hypothetical protein